MVFETKCSWNQACSNNSFQYTSYFAFNVIFDFLSYVVFKLEELAFLEGVFVAASETEFQA